MGSTRELDLRSQSEDFKRPDSVPVHVYLVPPKTVPGGRRMGMMIVMPAFAECEKRDQEVIGRIISRGKTSRAPEVSS